MRWGPTLAWVALASSALLGCALVAGCGGGGGSSTTPSGASNPISQNVPQPTPSAAASGFSATTTVAIAATAGPVAITLPSTGGYSGQATLPLAGVPAGTQLTQTLTSTAPGGIPTLSRMRRACERRAVCNRRTNTDAAVSLHHVQQRPDDERRSDVLDNVAFERGRRRVPARAVCERLVDGLCGSGFREPAGPFS